MTNTTPAPIGADAALARLVAAVEAETDPDWVCNSYHPSLWPALRVARAALANAAQPADTITASEAVFAFAAWLTCRDEAVTLGSAHDAAGAAELAGAFVASQGLAQPRDDYHQRLRPYTAVAPKAAQPEREPHPPHRDCGCAECAPSFETDAEDSLVSLLAECRDAFPVPPPGDPLGSSWACAMSDPSEVPGYLRAIAAAPKAAPAVPHAQMTEEIDNILSDPDTQLSPGAERALRWLRTWTDTPLALAAARAAKEGGADVKTRPPAP